MNIPKGDFSGEECGFARRFAEVYKLPNEAIMVELGTYFGRSTVCWAEGLAKINAKLITVDSHKNYIMPIKYTGTKCVENLNDSELKNIIIIIANFKDVIKFFNCEINALFIDGAHEYESVKADFDNWADFIKQDGYLLFHDYNKDHPGVLNFCDELKLGKNWQFIELCGSIIIFKRK